MRIDRDFLAIMGLVALAIVFVLACHAISGGWPSVRADEATQYELVQPRMQSQVITDVYEGEHYGYGYDVNTGLKVTFSGTYRLREVSHD